MSDVKKLESCFPCNPFEMKDLAKINNTEVRYGKYVSDALSPLENIGKLQFLIFL